MVVNSKQLIRGMYVLLGCLQNMTMGGVIFGWGSLLAILLGDREEGGVGLNIDYTHILFVSACFSASLGQLCLGFVLDSNGPRFCSIVSILTIVLGCVSISAVKELKSHYLLTSICLIAFGGAGVQNAIIHLSNLFPHWRASITSIITGSFQLSFFVFYFFDHIWKKYELNYRQIFLIYATFCLLQALLSLCMWPDAPYEIEPDPSPYPPIVHMQPTESTQLLYDNIVVLTEKECKERNRYKPKKICIKERTLYQQVRVYVCIQLCV